MSSASSEFFTLDGKLLGHGVYFGTSDTMEPQIVSSSDEAWKIHDNHSKADLYWNRLKSCDHARQHCIAYSDYGGYWWEGECCTECKVFHGPLSPWPDYLGNGGAEMHEGHPFEDK